MALSSAAGGPALSVCLIARNEEERLPAAIRSAAPFAAETIVVDTGSEDRTAETARSLGAKVIEKPWRDDFAGARNHGLEAATGEWILCIDADEILPEREGRKLRRLLEDRNAGAWYVRLRSVLAGEQQGRVFEHAFPRLFRNRPEHRFEGRVHEQILPSLERAGARVLFCSLVIEHSGYAVVGEARRRKLERNIRLLRMDREERPDDPLVLFHLGETHTLLDEPAEAEKAYAGAIRIGGLTPDHLAAALQNRAAAILRLGRHAEAIDEAERALRVGSGAADAAWLVIASARIRSGDPAGAVRDADRYLRVCGRALERGRTVLGFTPDRAKARLLRGEALFRMGRFQEAMKEAEHAVRENHAWGGGHRLLGRAAAAREEWERAEEAFRRALEADPGHAPTRRDLALLQARRGGAAAALRTIEDGLRPPEDPLLLEAQGRLRIAAGDLAGAAESYRGLAERVPGSAEAHRRLAGLYHKLGDSEKAREHLEESRRSSPDLPLPHKIST